MQDSSKNVARRLGWMAQQLPGAVAVVETLRHNRQGKRMYRQVTFRELEADSNRIAQGLQQLGAKPGTRLALLVRPGIDFVSLVFALFKAGTVPILIDPGMGRQNLIGCLAEAEPEGFVAIPMVHAVRAMLRRKFPKARLNVTVGRRWFWGGTTLAELRKAASGANSDDSKSAAERWQPVASAADDPAAIIFTTGSTGVPKGVLYSHGNFDAQVEQIRDFYGIQPGEIDMPCFPLFGLFNCAMGVTAVIPDMDPSRPAQVDPRNILEAARDWNVTQAFGSPAIWNRVGRYCELNRLRIPTIRRVLSAGAPIPAAVLRRTKACIHEEGEVHTPYGATESLPVASNSASEVLGETVEQTRQGGGVCVGRRFPEICWKVIRIDEGPIASIDQIEELPRGAIGELIVTGPQVTRQYVTRKEANALAKIVDGEKIWHRIGDAGYLDERDRFWFCGRVAHRVLTPTGPMYPVCCEAIFNLHPNVRRTALVGVGAVGQQWPVMIVEPHEGLMPGSSLQRESFVGDLRQMGAGNPVTAGIETFLFHPNFPVDIRHNAKIFREKLAVWAAEQLGKAG